MPLINCKTEFKFKCSVLSAAGNDIQMLTNPNIINFIIKDTKLYVPLVTLSVRGIGRVYAPAF